MRITIKREAQQLAFALHLPYFQARQSDAFADAQRERLISGDSCLAARLRPLQLRGQPHLLQILPLDGFQTLACRLKDQSERQHHE
ncbi:hypothetical protein D3C78_1735490 [compost metagenome]